jgi:AsmA-like C-terminal region
VNGQFRYLSPGTPEALSESSKKSVPLKKSALKSPEKTRDPKLFSPPPLNTQPVLSGEVGVSSLSLAAADSERPFTLAGVRLVMESQSAASASGSPDEPVLLLEPVRLALGAPAPLAVDGRLTLEGFDFHLGGSGTLARLHRLSHALGLLSASTGRLLPEDASSEAPAGETSAGAGDLTLDVDVRGPWLLPVPDAEHPSASATTTVGSIAIRNAEISTSYLSQPLMIASAQVILGPDEISWTNASISYGPVQAQGTLEYPIVCDTPAPCPGQFQLVAPTLDVGELQSTLLGVSRSQSQSGELLREILSRIERHPVLWPRLSGTIQVGALSSGKLVLHDATGAVEIVGRSLAVRSLNGRLLNGVIHLTGTVDATEDQPEYSLDVQVTHASPSAFAQLFGEQWGSGLVNLSAQWKMSGFEPSSLAQSASGSLHWSWSRGALAAGNTLPAAAESLQHFDDWSGDAVIEDSTIRIRQSVLARASEAIPLSGTISFSREMELKSESESPGFSITGTLEHPEVKSLTTEADAHTLLLRRAAGH